MGALYFCDHKKKFFLPKVFSSRGKDKATFAFTITRHTLTPPPDDNLSIFSPSYFASLSLIFLLGLHLLFSKMSCIRAPIWSPRGCFHVCLVDHFLKQKKIIMKKKGEKRR
jgi:hypothetical protein